MLAPAFMARVAAVHRKHHAGDHGRGCPGEEQHRPHYLRWLAQAAEGNAGE